MANLLQDQLLKAGLAKPEQLKKATKEQRQAQRGNAPNTAAEQARLAQQKKIESDRIRNQEQQAQRERKAQAAEIRQLIEAQKLDRSGGESAFQFVDGGKIRKIHVQALIYQRRRFVRVLGTTHAVWIPMLAWMALRLPSIPQGAFRMGSPDDVASSERDPV